MNELLTLLNLCVGLGVLGMVAVLAVAWSYLVGTSRWGQKLLAIRDDEVAAQAMGIRTTRVKVSTFAGSAVFPGMAGATYARHVGYIDPVTVFGIIWSIRAITTTIFGGRGTVLGTVLGLFAIVILQNGLRLAALPSEFAGILTGALLIVTIAADRLARSGSPATHATG